jgi:nucleotide-binding universal stress UspA family protein
MNSEDTYRIVVGHDLEKTGDEALREAVALAVRIAGSEIHVIHAVAHPSSRDIEGNGRLLDAAMEDLRRRAAAMAASVAPNVLNVPARLHVRFGDIVETILQVAVDYDASVVLVGTHARTGLDRLRNGSVAERVARTARLPVLVAHVKDFTGMSPSIRPDDPRPGAELHRDQARSEVGLV